MKKNSLQFRGTINSFKADNDGVIIQVKLGTQDVSLDKLKELVSIQNFFEIKLEDKTKTIPLEIDNNRPLINNFKIDSEYFNMIKNGIKTFEIRKNDRNFYVGDKLILREYDHYKQNYTGRQLTAKVTYITDFAQRNGYEGFGLSHIKEIQ